MMPLKPEYLMNFTDHLNCVIFAPFLQIFISLMHWPRIFSNQLIVTLKMQSFKQVYESRLLI